MIVPADMVGVDRSRANREADFRSGRVLFVDQEATVKVTELSAGARQTEMVDLPPDIGVSEIQRPFARLGDGRCGGGRQPQQGKGYQGVFHGGLPL